MHGGKYNSSSYKINLKHFSHMLQGIWTLCINLSQEEVKQLRSKGFPPREHCVNYLASNEIRNEESRPDWQHSESQTPLRPHLSRYNNVLRFKN